MSTRIVLSRRRTLIPLDDKVLTSLNLDRLIRLKKRVNAEIGYHSAHYYCDWCNECHYPSLEERQTNPSIDKDYREYQSKIEELYIYKGKILGLIRSKKKEQDLIIK